MAGPRWTPELDGNSPKLLSTDFQALGHNLTRDEKLSAWGVGSIGFSLHVLQDDHDRGLVCHPQTCSANLVGSRIDNERLALETISS